MSDSVSSVVGTIEAVSSVVESEGSGVNTAIKVGAGVAVAGVGIFGVYKILQWTGVIGNKDEETAKDEPAEK